MNFRGCQVTDPWKREHTLGLDDYAYRDPSILEIEYASLYGLRPVSGALVIEHSEVSNPVFFFFPGMRTVKMSIFKDWLWTWSLNAKRAGCFLIIGLFDGLGSALLLAALSN
jgi:hypothetical protein